MANGYVLGAGRLYRPGSPPEVVMELKLPEFTPYIEGNPQLRTYQLGWFKAIKRGFMAVRHKATGRTAIAIPAPKGCCLVQFNNVKAMGPLSSGWHLYPRHHFKRRRLHK